MNDTGKTDGQPSRKSIPLWLALAMFFLVWCVIPWALSLIGRRYGWSAGSPGPWNWLGLVLVAIGLTGSLWGLQMHAAAAGHRVDFEVDKNYMLSRGVYAYSRHPMYLFELTLMLGWVVFYANIAVLIAFLAWLLLFNLYQVPMEERVLEKHFGDEYLQYKRQVRRWIGKRRGL